jgi:hypothetical protein
MRRGMAEDSRTVEGPTMGSGAQGEGFEERGTMLPRSALQDRPNLLKYGQEVLRRGASVVESRRRYSTGNAMILSRSFVANLAWEARGVVLGVLSSGLDAKDPSEGRRRLGNWSG